MKCIKRNGQEVEFNNDKIRKAVTNANNNIDEMSKRLSTEQIEKITEDVTKKCEHMGRAVGVEEIQDMVEFAIMNEGKFDVAKHYITYRYTRQLARQKNTTDDKVFHLSIAKMKKLNKKIATKTQPSTVFKEIIWLAK